MAEPSRTIPNADAHDIETGVSLERMVSARGLKLVKKGAALTGTCPFHPRSKTPPMITVNPASNTWACPRCKVTDGTVVEWTMRAEGVSHRHAIELLRADHGGGTGKVVKRSSVKKLTDALDSKADDAKLVRQVIDYYAASLKKTPTALVFLAKNGVTDPEALLRFRIGFADRTLGYTIPDANRREGAEVRGRLHRLGLIKSSGHETFRGCVTIPLLDESGALISIYGRRIQIDKRKTDSPDVYLNAKGVWNREALTASKEIVLTSTIFDALVSWCSGVRYVTAVTNENMDEVIALVGTTGATKITFLFPRTDAGEATASSIRERLIGANVELHRALLPTGMDVLSFVTSATGSDALVDIIRKAEWIGGVKPRSVETTALPATVPVAITESAASPTPMSPSGEIVIEHGDRRWRVRGLSANTSYERLRVHLYVSRETGSARTSGYFVDMIELYSARQRSSFIEQAAEELGTSAEVIKRDLGHVLLRLEAIQDEQIKAALKPKVTTPTMSEAERQAALGLLRDPHLLDRIVHDFDRTGVVGETDNKLLGYLAAVSRKLPEPLAVLVQSSSASGKSSLMDAVLSFVPEEDRVEYSAMTGQALYYVEPGQLRHRVLAIAEEGGAHRAAYALKLLQSAGSLTIASTAKEAGTGRMVTHEYRVEGPVALMLTTTATVLDEELLNRCLILSINEGREQTRAIHERQRDAETIEGVLARHDREAILHLHRNAQRLLRAIVVVNPYAKTLTFPDGTTRARRDHKKLLTLIRAIALLHQHQRDVKRAEHEGAVVEYIEATPDDVAVAERLMASVLPTDELPPHTRHVLGLLDAMVTSACSERGIEKTDYRFTRREARERLGVGGTQLWTHLRRLVDGEYLYVHPSKRGRGVTYELAHVDAATTDGVRGDGLDVRGSSGLHSGQVRGAETSTPSEETRGVGRERSGSTSTRHTPRATSSRRTSTSA